MIPCLVMFDTPELAVPRLHVRRPRRQLYEKVVMWQIEPDVDDHSKDCLSLLQNSIQVFWLLVSGVLGIDDTFDVRVKSNCRKVILDPHDLDRDDESDPQRPQRLSRQYCQHFPFRGHA